MKFKRGDTFSFRGFASIVIDGVLLTDITGWVIRAQVRRTKSGGYTLVEELGAVWILTAGEFALDSTGSTGWPVGVVEIDIQFTNGAVVVSTETQQIEVVPDVTYG